MNAQQDMLRTPEERYEAAAFELAIHQMMKRDMNAVKNSADIETSAALEHAAQERMPDMLAFIDQQMEKTKKHATHWQQHLFHILKVAAIVILMMNLGFTIAAATSPTIRAKVIHFLTDITPSYIQIGFQPTGIHVDVPDNWSETYYPGYIPDGYRLVDSISRSGISRAEYADAENNSLVIKICDVYASSRLNTENAQLSYTTIQGNNAMVIEQAYGEVNIIWTAGNHYFVVSGCDFQLTKSVADSMQVIQTEKNSQ